MNFIHFKDDNVFVRLDKIVAVWYSNMDKKTVIDCGSGGTFRVSKPTSEVIDLIRTICKGETNE